jgi:hypothetical protein
LSPERSRQTGVAQPGMLRPAPAGVAAQLIERISWALADAEDPERAASRSYPTRPAFEPSSVICVGRLLCGSIVGVALASE